MASPVPRPQTIEKLVGVVNGPLTGSFEVAVLSRFIQVLSADQARRALQWMKTVAGPELAARVRRNLWPATARAGDVHVYPLQGPHPVVTVLPLGGISAIDLTSRIA